MFKCIRCGCNFQPEYVEDADGEEYAVSVHLCYHCFEEGVEEHEERKRERIARENEY